MRSLLEDRLWGLCPGPVACLFLVRTHLCKSLWSVSSAVLSLGPHWPVSALLDAGDARISSGLSLKSLSPWIPLSS